MAITDSWFIANLQRLPPRAQNVVAARNITTTEAFLALSYSDWLQVPGCGKRTATELAWFSDLVSIIPGGEWGL